MASTFPALPKWPDSLVFGHDVGEDSGLGLFENRSFLRGFFADSSADFGSKLVCSNIETDGPWHGAPIEAHHS